MERTPDLDSYPPLPGRGTNLPGEHFNWPTEARAAFRELQRQLDGWCRDRGWPTTFNAWVAEAAVRQVWGSESPEEVPGRRW